MVCQLISDRKRIQAAIAFYQEFSASVILYVHLVIKSFGTNQACRIEIETFGFRWHPTHKI